MKNDKVLTNQKDSSKMAVQNDVVSQDLFVVHVEPTVQEVDASRLVSFVRNDTQPKTRWDIVLDGENTDISFSQNLVDSIKTSGRYDMVSGIIDGLVEDLKDYGGYELTLDEHLDLTKLFFSLL